jgi:hypothetical protein
MKITLTQNDVLLAVREYLTRQGFEVPDADTEMFGLFYDQELGTISVEVDGIRVHAVNLPPARTEPGPAPWGAGRFEPPPSPPREARNEPDRVLDAVETLPERLQNEKSIRAMVGQSQEFIRKIPDPARAQHQPARDRFSRVQVAPSIEEFGKDPEDFKDEI